MLLVEYLFEANAMFVHRFIVPFFSCLTALKGVFIMLFITCFSAVC